MPHTKQKCYETTGSLFNAIFIKTEDISVMTDNIEGQFASVYDSLFGVVLAPVRKYTATLISRFTCHQVVDLGCGTGDQCIHIWHQNPGVIIQGIDISPRMISVARKESPPEILYHVADSRTTGFEDDQFDCCIISLVLHAQNSEDREKLLEEACRIVKAKGIIVLTDFGVIQSWKGIISHAVLYMVESFTLDDHRKNFHHFRKNGGIHALLEKQGFPLVKSKSFYSNAIVTIVACNE